MKSVKAQDTYASANHIVLPNDTNTLGNLMGGQLLNWMDINSAISAHRHCRRVVVTASVSHVSFAHPIRLGDIVTIESKVSRAYTTSMEVYIDVWVEDHVTGEKIKCNEAIYTFVAVDQLGRPIEVPELVPETDIEKQQKAEMKQQQQASLLRKNQAKEEMGRRFGFSSRRGR